METPSSMRRVTRSQTLTAPMSRKKEEPKAVISRSRKGKSERSALFDITNDSPIVGLAMGSLETPSSVAKNNDRAKRTPGTGEALLRDQVKTLLQKVEEDADLPKISFHQRHFSHFQGLFSSPAAVLAPTPANTPFISNSLEGNTVIEIDGFPIAMSVTEEQDPKNDQVTNCLQQEALESHESLITRALLFDSPGKSEISESSTLSSGMTFQGSCCNGKPDVDEDTSRGEEKIREEEEYDVEVEDEGGLVDELCEGQIEVEALGELEDSEEVVIGELEDYEEERDAEDDDDGGLIDELCEGLKKVCVQEQGGALAECQGRHTRFIYNSDDEIEGEEEVKEGSSISPSILRLKGMPVPEGKHLRFPEED